METVVLRAFEDGALGEDDLIAYLFSIVATDEGVQFVYPEGSTAFSLDDMWVQENIKRLEIETPTTIDDWLSAAIHRLNRISFFDGPETYESVEDAVTAETEFAAEARALQEDELRDSEEDDIAIDVIDTEDEEE